MTEHELNSVKSSDTTSDPEKLASETSMISAPIIENNSPASDLPADQTNSMEAEPSMVLQVAGDEDNYASSFTPNGNGNGEAKKHIAINDASITNTPVSNSPPESWTNEDTSKQLHVIDPSSGICTSCNDTEALKTSLTCMFCSVKFHAVCRNADTDKTGTDIICARTFYKSYVQVTSKEGIYTRRFGNFAFVCNMCKTKAEAIMVATQTNKIDKMDRRIDNLANNISEIKAMLAASCTTPKTTPVD